jgi:hypothetical protein
VSIHELGTLLIEYIAAQLPKKYQRPIHCSETAANQYQRLIA